MAKIKSVKKAHTVPCRDAVTKEAVHAVFSESHSAVYKDIDIHKVKSANVLQNSGESAYCIYSSFSAAPVRRAAIDCIHTDTSGYKKVNQNLTIEELFKDIK
ncbi:MAG TPA: hypothetical protein DCZ23_01345 [Lachnospiraceae bacterium]|nr:hypothetical protein [Lachnospiraceae bacterium]